MRALEELPLFCRYRLLKGSLVATFVFLLGCAPKYNVLTINDLDQFALDVVETARENLVIGQA